MKNWVKVKSGATLESTIALKPARNPVETNQPKTAANTPSRRKGNWIEKLVAPTNYITPVSRLLLKAAILKVLLINNAAVNTEAAPIARAPFRNTPSNLKNFSKIAC